MAQPASLLIFPAMLVTVPAFAQERPAAVAVNAGPVAEAARALSLQLRASIALRDARLATRPVAAVRGTMTVKDALEQMLAGSGMQARRVAPSSYIIEPVRVARRAPAPSVAQPGVPPVVHSDEIVVTATKRYVPLRYYAGGAQVIDGDRVTVAEATRGTGVIESRAASVTSTHLGPGRNKLFIRGIADSSLVGPTQATVGQYWGNSRITYSAPDPSLRLYDVGSVEVLEGPQGTLYGAGSLGGVVRVVPRAPDLYDFGASAWGGAQLVEHGDAGVDGGALINLPIVEGSLGFRALAFGSVEGGYIDDRERGLRDVNRVRTVGARAGLRWDPGDDWRVDISALGQRIRGSDGQYADRLGSGLDRATSIAQPFRNDYWLADVVARKQWGAVELTGSLGYAGQHVFEQFEGARLSSAMRPDLAPSADAQATAYTQDNRIRMLTGELRLARRGPEGSGWLVAASLLHNVAQVRRTMGEEIGIAKLTGVRNEISEATLYGENSVRLLPGLNLTLGARITHSELSGQSRDVAILAALREDPEAADTRTETRLLPSASLAWAVNQEVTLFTRYQEGFRPGGIAVRQDYIQRFEGDRVSTIDIGGRYSSRDLETALTLSWTNWRNIQADLIDGFGFPTTDNLGRGRVITLGWSGQWRPAGGVELDAAVYLNDSRLIQISIMGLIASIGEINRQRLPNVADVSARLGARYSMSLSDGQQVDAHIYGRYVGKSTLGIGSILGRVQGDHLDTGLEVRVGDGRRGISLSVTNLFDSVGNRFALGSPFLVRDQNQITPLQPRTIRLGFDLNF